MTISLAGPLLLVGAGKMGGALLEGWLRQGLDPASINRYPSLSGSRINPGGFSGMTIPLLPCSYASS